MKPKKTLQGGWLPGRSTKEVPKEKQHTPTPKGQRDASDTFESESSASETESEASVPENNHPPTNGDASLEKISEGSETDNTASDGDTFEDGDLEDCLEFLEEVPYRKLLAAYLYDNYDLAKDAIDALDTKDTASEKFTRLLEKMTLNSARLGHLNVLDILLAYMMDHLSDPSEFSKKLINELVMVRFSRRKRLEIVHILFTHDIKINCNPSEKRSELEWLMMGPN